MRDDVKGAQRRARGAHFNPRPSHEGRQGATTEYGRAIGHFNPRPSHEGRRGQRRSMDELLVISIHVPRMRDDGLDAPRDHAKGISIHVPRMRDDRPPAGGSFTPENFNPRPSHEGRQQAVIGDILLDPISIHVPRMRDDRQPKSYHNLRLRFQSTSLA